ncbi:MAG: ATP-binding protein [Longimicrobiales bacterium]
MTLRSKDSGRSVEPEGDHEIGVGRVRVPILAGAALFVVHIALTLGAEGLTPPWRTGLWATGVGAVLLLGYGIVSLGRRAGAAEERARDLSLTRSQLQALIEASPLAVVAGDEEGRILLWSAAAEETFGWTAEEVVGRSYPAVADERDESWRELRERVLGGKTIQGAETQRVTRAGEIIEVSISAAPVRDGRGEIAGTVALVDDLSQARGAAREVEQLETQLRQAQKLEVVGRLAAGIAHDFNNLLTAIRGNAELILAADDVGAEMGDALREISRSAERAAALTRQLLTFTHRGPVEAFPMDVNRLVKGMETLMQRLIGETIELRVELSVDTGAVLTDPNQIEQVLLNLVVNARDAMPEGGPITVRTGTSEVGADEAGSLPYDVRPGPYAVITVDDNGVGMEPETAQRIFEPFFTTKPAGVGTGLGLSTVYSIVKQARGHIRVDTAPGEGTRFHVYLPRAEEEEAAAATEERAPVADNGGFETILVAEDEEAVLSMAQRTLERQGYKVLPALSGREALGLTLKYPGEIHVLFCDVVMPDLTGREVAERVKGARPDIEVLMTSGYGERQLNDEGVLKDLPFLAKPYTPAELAARIRQLLGTAAPS